MTASTFQAKAPTLVARLVADLGLTPEQACGALGNLGEESSGLTELQEIHPRAGAGGAGWAQWTGPRRTKFLSWCSAQHLDPGSDEANYGYLVYDLQHDYRAALAALKAATSLSDATRIFEERYEVAGVVAMDIRLQWAQRAYDAWVAAGKPTRSATSDNQSQSVVATDNNRPAPAPIPSPLASDIAELQADLRALGWLGRGAKIDGVYGPVSEAAVRAYQTFKHLTVDGRVGPETWAEFDRDMARLRAEQPASPGAPAVPAPASPGSAAAPEPRNPGSGGVQSRPSTNTPNPALGPVTPRKNWSLPMDLSKYVTKGTVTGALSAAGMVAAMFGKSQLAAFFANPETAQTILAIVSGIGAVSAGVLQGVTAKGA